MICPNLQCGRTVVAAEGARGKVVRCAHCQTLFLVPRESRPEEQPEEEKPEGKRRT
jgi:LSD1 subclass zinc finger protein